MAKKRASLKGKGRTILMGEESIEESPSVSADASPETKDSAPPEDSMPETTEQPDLAENGIGAVEAPTEEVEAMSLPTIEHYYAEEEEPAAPHVSLSSTLPPGETGEEIDWSAMIEDEIATAKLPAEEDDMSSLPPIEYHYPEEEPAVPESELPAIEQPVVTEPELEFPTPSVTPGAPAQPSPAADQPPPGTPQSSPEMRIGGLLAGMSLAEMQKLAPPGPGFEEPKMPEIVKAPPKELTEEEEELVIKRVTRKQRQELFERISQLYEEAPKKLAASGLKARRYEALMLLSQARDIVLEDPRQFDEAEQRVWQVEAIIANAQDVVKWSHHYGNRLIAYLTTWFVILMATIVFFNRIAAWLEEFTAPQVELFDFAPITVAPLLFTMLWGGIGGIVGGLYSLWKHIAEKQDFDKQYTVWYTLQPISGIVLGGIIHVFVMAGFLSMFYQVAGAEAVADQGNQAVFWFPVLLAVIAGFRQNFVYALIDRVVELVGQGTKKPEE